MMGYFDAHGDEHLAAQPLEKDEDYEYGLWKQKQADTAAESDDEH